MNPLAQHRPKGPDLLFRNRICLSVDGADLGKAQGITRDFRSCTTTVMVGPTFMLAHGPAGVRSLSELGMTDIVIDARLFGGPSDLWASVIEVAKLGARGITVQPTVGPRILSLATRAAVESTSVTHRIRTPLVLGAAMPPAIDNRDLCACYGTRHLRKTYIAKHAALFVTQSAAGMLVNYNEVDEVRKVSNGLPLLVAVQRRVYGYTERVPRAERELAGVAAVLRSGATHVIYGMEFAGNDAEWTADMLVKELRACDDP